MRATLAKSHYRSKWRGNQNRQVFHFSPPCNHTRRFLDPSLEGQVHLMIRSGPLRRSVCARISAKAAERRFGEERGRRAQMKGDCFAKAYISTAQETPRQDARVSRAHEVSGRPESSCGTPQEGTPSPYARVKRGGNIRAARASCARRISTLFTATGSAARVPTSPCS